jgi:hypothetical protein
MGTTVGIAIASAWPNPWVRTIVAGVATLIALCLIWIPRPTTAKTRLD